ncbi:MAG: prealbumin-like fold domain-containing protein [Lachnospiraceae bacterium]
MSREPVPFRRNCLYGTYYLRELQAPEGYLKGEDLCFTVDKWGSWTKPME